MNELKQKPRILVADDWEINIELVENTLANEYNLSVALNGEMALKLAQELHPDLILLDVMMPGISGFDVCEQLKLNPSTKDIPVIFLTSLSDGINESKGLALGAIDYISKPFNPDLLKARIKNNLSLRAYQTNLESIIEERTSKLFQTQNTIITGMAMLAEYRDPETGAHLQRTSHYIECLIKELAPQFEELQDPNYCYQVTYSAQLHDIGKVGTPDSILLKPGKLTSDEFKIMCQHAEIGEQILAKTESFLKGNSFLQRAKEIAGGHHEKWNGSGYPRGLKGEEIPLSARLMTIADIYDALISKRPYKEPFSHLKAVEIITEGDGRTLPEHFDPRILAAFKRIHLQIEQIALTFQDS